MSSIRFALEKLDRAITRLDESVCDARDSYNSDSGNVIDVDFVSRRLDRAIASVEQLLAEGE